MGEYNMVIFTPDFLNIIKSGPSERRQFLDLFISQIKPSYFKNLISYYRVLHQRNNVLKSKDKNMLLTLDVWDEKLARLGVEISKARKMAIEKINNTINKLDEDKNFTENIKLVYNASVKGNFEDYENFLENLIASRERDIEKGVLTEEEAQELIDQYVIKDKALLLPLNSIHNVGGSAVTEIIKERNENGEF